MQRIYCQKSLQDSNLDLSIIRNEHFYQFDDCGSVIISYWIWNSRIKLSKEITYTKKFAKMNSFKDLDRDNRSRAVQVIIIIYVNKISFNNVNELTFN